MAKRKKSTLERLHSGSLNRQQRKELERRFNAAEPDLEIVHPHAAGIDIGKPSRTTKTRSRALASSTS